MRILLVEDIVDLADAVRTHLASLGYAVDWCADGAAVADRLKEAAYDLVILDIMLPKRDGFQILSDLRRAGAACRSSSPRRSEASTTRSIFLISAPTTTS